MKTLPFGRLELRLFPLPEGGALCRVGRPGGQLTRIDSGEESLRVRR